MNKYDLIALNALLLLIIALPLYALREPERMRQAETKLRQQYLTDGALMYVENCAFCHGASGEGIGAMPTLNNPGLAEADADIIYRTIAHSPHGSKMAAWHVEEGGILNDYQVKGLVTLIKYGDWGQVSQLAAARGFEPPAPSLPDVEFATLEGWGEAEPHECRSCHEDPEVHANRFGLNCARCHGLEAWKPALLTQHIFHLDHGGKGQVACETCHTESYVEHTCYQCHNDHQPDQMREVHLAEGLAEFDNCIECHPTGQAGEAEQIVRSRANPTAQVGPIIGVEPDHIQLAEHLVVPVNRQKNGDQ